MVILFGILCLVLLRFLFWSRERDPFSTIPGPTPLPLVGNCLIFFQGNFEDIWLNTMKNLKKEYGNVVRFYIGTKPQIFLFGAEGFEKILSSSKHITKGRVKTKFRLCSNLLTITGCFGDTYLDTFKPMIEIRCGIDCSDFNLNSSLVKS